MPRGQRRAGGWGLPATPPWPSSPLAFYRSSRRTQTRLPTVPQPPGSYLASRPPSLGASPGRCVLLDQKGPHVLPSRALSPQGPKRGVGGAYSKPEWGTLGKGVPDPLLPMCISGQGTETAGPATCFPSLHPDICLRDGEEDQRRAEQASALNLNIPGVREDQIEGARTMLAGHYSAAQRRRHEAAPRPVRWALGSDVGQTCPGVRWLKESA